MGKRKAREVYPSHCTSCGVSMDQMACSIGWKAVRIGDWVREYVETLGRLPSYDALAAFADTTSSDPCDDCCCGACGQRKEYPGQCCC